MEPAELEHRHLRDAIEFVVAVVREGRKRRPPLPYPGGMKKYLTMNRLPGSALGPLRRIIEGDDEFRRRMGIAAGVPDVVDPIGLLWLTRPDGWEQQVADLVARAEDAEREADNESAMRRERKRREAAEQATARSRAEIVTLKAQLAELGSTLDEQRERIAELEVSLDVARHELGAARTDARHANDRAEAAQRRLERLRADREAADADRRMAESIRDQALADRVDAGVDAAEVGELRLLAGQLLERLETISGRLAGDRSPRRSGARRRPVPLPGGVAGDSDAATEHLLRSGAAVLVDGYNVSMLGWPDLGIAEQRRALIESSENLARRFGADVTIVFDGADITGAAADRRRLVRVVYSPDEVTADDVIRAEVERLPASRSVVVVTDDAEIVRDVRELGANTVGSQRYLVTARR